MGIKHKAVKVSNEKGYASEWNAEHVFDSNLDIQPYRIAGGEPISAPDYATKNYVDAFAGPPIGTIQAWLKSFPNTPALPSNWVECNGQVLSDANSVYNGQTIPNLNGENRFLRGNSTSGGTGGSTTTSSGDNTVRSNVTTGTGAYINLHPHTHIVTPPYYNVVWIMRIK